MGIQGVGTGYPFGMSQFDIYLFCCKSFVYKGVKFQTSDFDIDKWEENDFDGYDFSDYDTYELHDDIEYIDSTFVYKYNHNIKIGIPHCCPMIYILESTVYDPTSDTFEVEDEVVLMLIEWKNLLVKQQRIDKNVKFSTIMHCCC